MDSFIYSNATMWKPLFLIQIANGGKGKNKTLCCSKRLTQKTLTKTMFAAEKLNKAIGVIQFQFKAS